MHYAINSFYAILEFIGLLLTFYFRKKAKIGKNFKLFLGGGIIGRKNKILIGDNVKLFGWLISENGIITIGDNSSIHSNTIIRSMNNIKIGSYCDIGSNCYIQDHNSMSLNYKEREKLSGEIINKPITIGDHVWIGRQTMIFKGVSIGDRTIIGAGSIVTRNIPADSIAAGNPAKVVKKILIK